MVRARAPGGPSEKIASYPKRLYRSQLSWKVMLVDLFDVAIVGAGPAGSACAGFCALAGLKTVVLERERFPREKVCGDCLNPSCWPILNRLGISERARRLPHAILNAVEFIAIGGQRIVVDFESSVEKLIAVKRSLFDELILSRARELTAEIHEETTVTTLTSGTKGSEWKIGTAQEQPFTARVLVGADGRNSTVARLCNLLPRPARERVALQAHIPLPAGFDDRIVLQFLSEGYSGQAPVNCDELNLCLVSKPSHISALRRWAEQQFGVRRDHPWHTITPLTRTALPPARDNLFLIGDAARVVEPFTGEGIYYAMRSGELAAHAIKRIIHGLDDQSSLREFARNYATMYHGRLWINHLARAAVLSPQIASLFVRVAPFSPTIMRLLTEKIAGKGALP